MLTRYDKFVPSQKTWNNVFTLYARQSGKNYTHGHGLREQLKVETPVEDAVLREMIDNIDFAILYRSIEFRKKLRERLNYYEKL